MILDFERDKSLHPDDVKAMSESEAKFVLRALLGHLWQISEEHPGGEVYPEQVAEETLQLAKDVSSK